MKQGIHPPYYEEAKVTCLSCGQTYTIGSTKPSLQVEVCSACHPFFTGEERFADTLGRVERFQRKQKTGAQYAERKRKKLAKKEKGKEKQEAPKTLREMLMAQRKKALE